jgi:hypothetical protein
LRSLSRGYRLVAILSLVIAAVLAALMIVALLGGNTTAATSLFFAALGLAASAVTCFAISEAIVVFLDIEENTRATRQKLECGRQEAASSAD